jgi:flagellar protein FliL
MKQFIPAILVVFGIVAGGAGGHFLKSMSANTPKSGEHEPAEASEDKETNKADAAHTNDEGKKETKKSAKKDAHGGSEETASSSGSVYHKFSREFIVPIMEDGRVKSLVILNINLEAESSISQTLFEMEPKLRDNIMTTLIGLSGDGVTFDNLTDVDSYETIRSMILMNLETIVASGITNVLIVDMARQDL